MFLSTVITETAEQLTDQWCALREDMLGSPVDVSANTPFWARKHIRCWYKLAGIHVHNEVDLFQVRDGVNCVANFMSKERAERFLQEENPNYNGQLQLSRKTLEDFKKEHAPCEVVGKYGAAVVNAVEYELCDEFSRRNPTFCPRGLVKEGPL